MADLAGVDLCLEHLEYSAGGCFRVEGDRLRPATARLPEGDVVDLIPSARQVRVLLKEPRGWDTLAEHAHERAQQGLDLLAIQGQGAGILPHGYERHVLWARGSVVALRIGVLQRVGATMSVSAEVRDAQGRLKPSPIPAPQRWNPALRYFRLSQAAGDAFDAYRSMFLALEALLSDAVPQGPRGERAWLEHALKEVARRGLVDLSNYVAIRDDAIARFVEEQYEARRCALFHAKHGRGALLPGTSERTLVVEALESLSRLVVDLARQLLDVVFPSSGMTIAAFETVVVDGLGDTFELALGADPSALREEQVMADLKSVPLITLDTEHSGRLDKVGRLHGFLGRAPASRFTVGIVDSVFGLSGNELVTRHRIPRLDLAGIDEVQVLFAWLLNNPQQPKARFAL